MSDDKVPRASLLSPEGWLAIAGVVFQLIKKLLGRNKKS